MKKYRLIRFNFIAEDICKTSVLLVNVTLRCDYKSLIMFSTVFKVCLVKMDPKETSRRPLPVIGREKKDVMTSKKRT